MNKLCAYILITLFALSQTELHQLLKVPALIIHYFEHLQDEELGFANYLHNHYCHEHHKCGQENGEHKHLPFQCSDCVHFFVTCVLPSPQVFELNAIEIFAEHHAVERSQALVTVSYDIWQPPKV